MNGLRVVLDEPIQSNPTASILLSKNFDSSLSGLESPQFFTPQNKNSKRSSNFFVRVSPRLSTVRHTTVHSTIAEQKLSSPVSSQQISGSDSPSPRKSTFRIKKPSNTILFPSVRSINFSNGMKTDDSDIDEVDEDLHKGSKKPFEEEKLTSVDEKPVQTCGLESVHQFYDHYKQLNKICDINGFKNVKNAIYTSFLKKSQDLSLLPTKIGVAKDFGDEEALKINNFRIGDKYAEVLAEGLKADNNYTKFNLANNRLTAAGADKILSKLSNRPQEINLSGNNIGKIGCEHLCAMLQQRNTQLLEINLEGNKLGDYALKALCDTIGDNDTIKRLNLSRNFITNKAAEDIGKMLGQNSSLEELYLRWNQIKSHGGGFIFEGLKTTSQLRVLDIAFNSLGLGGGNFAQSFAEYITKDTKMMHLDLSNNYINRTEALVISKAMESNHTAYGFHFKGNVGYVDAKGFLVIPDGFAQDMSGQATSHVIQGCNIQPESLKRYQISTEEYKDCCWICEGWRPIEVKWEPGSSGSANKDPVFVHFSYEGYRNRFISKSRKFKTVRMAPPTSFNYIFTVNGEQVCAEDQMVKQYVGTDIKFLMDEKVKLHTPVCMHYKSQHPVKNIITESFKPIDSIRDLDIKPRDPDEVYIPPEILIERGIWKFPISAFKEYKPDTPQLLDKCFEVDFEGTRIPKIIKNEEDTKIVRQIFYDNYKQLKDCYRHYAAIGAPSDIWSIPLNTYTEFCLTAGIIDGKYMKLSDFDRVFIATYTRTDKERNPRNPDRALVRFQFLEGLVRMADQKYIGNGLANTFPDALGMLMNDHVKPCISKFDHQKWRVERYWNEEVDTVIKSFMPVFKGAYKKYSGLKTLPGQRKFMCLEEFYRILNDMGLFNDNCGERDATLYYSLAMMTQVDELESDRIFQMQFVEFLEAFSRIADKFSAAPWGKTEAEIPYDKRFEQPLYLKVEGLMTRLYAVCGGDIKDIWVMPETTIFDMPEVKGRQRYTTKKKKLVRLDPTDPVSAEAYGV